MIPNNQEHLEAVHADQERQKDEYLKSMSPEMAETFKEIHALQAKLTKNNVPHFFLVDDKTAPDAFHFHRWYHPFKDTHANWFSQDALRKLASFMCCIAEQMLIMARDSGILESCFILKANGSRMFTKTFNQSYEASKEKYPPTDESAI